MRVKARVKALVKAILKCLLNWTPGRPDGADRRAFAAAAAARRQPVGEEPGGHHEGRHTDVGKRGEDPVLQESLDRLSTCIRNISLNNRYILKERNIDFSS